MEEKNWLEECMEKVADEAVLDALDAIDESANFGAGVTNARYVLVEHGLALKRMYKNALLKMLSSYKKEAEELSQKIQSGEMYKECLEEARQDEIEQYQHHKRELAFYGGFTAMNMMFAIIFFVVFSYDPTASNYQAIGVMLLILACLFCLRVIYEVISLVIYKPTGSTLWFDTEAKAKVEEAVKRKNDLYLRVSFIMKYLYDGSPRE